MFNFVLMETDDLHLIVCVCACLFVSDNQYRIDLVVSLEINSVKIDGIVSY